MSDSNNTVGRPRIDGETASTWLQVRVRPSEKEAWKAAASREGLSMSEWVTGCLNWHAEEVNPEG